MSRSDIPKTPPANAMDFNVTLDGRTYWCPVCGFEAFSGAPTYDARGHPTLGARICACCFWEPGYDDMPPATRKAKDDI